MSLRGLRVGAVVIVAALLGVACGSDSEPEAETDPGATAAPTEVSAEDWEPEYVDGVLQPLPDGFPEDPLTFVLADVAGSSDGVYARHMQTALRDIAPVAIEVYDQGGGQDPTWETMRWILDQKGGPDGYYPMVYANPALALDSLLINLEQDMELTLDDLSLLNVTETTPKVLVSRKDAPWGDSYEELIQYIKDGNEVKHISRPGTTSDIAMKRILAQNDIEVAQTAGGSHDENVAAVGAGQVDITITQAPTALSHWEAGKIEILLIVGDERAGEPWADVPSSADVGMPGEAWGSDRGWMVGTETPELHQAWLAELFLAGTEDEDFQESRKAIPGTLLFDPVIDAEGAAALTTTGLENAEPLIRELEMHWDQQ